VVVALPQRTLAETPRARGSWQAPGFPGMLRWKSGGAGEEVVEPADRAHYFHLERMVDRRLLDQLPSFPPMKEPLLG
jgi:hypothetical protein